jgi:hypothetical protein
MMKVHRCTAYMQGEAEGKVNILGGYIYGPFKQKYMCVDMSSSEPFPRKSYFTL